MAEKLTPEQEMAIHNRGGRLLISAAAGSGKTKVLVDRLMNYITDPVNPANIDDFLMITFTKAAASELRGKIAAKLTERVAQEPENHHLHRQLQRLYLAKISTVHSFCGDVLRQYAYQLDLPGDFRVADDQECLEIRRRTLEKLLDEAYANRLEDEAFRAFVDTQSRGRNDDSIGEMILDVHKSSRCHLNPKQWLGHCEDMVRGEDVTDAGETSFGRFLMERLFHWLDNQFPYLAKCEQMASEQGWDKVAAYFQEWSGQLRRLKSSKSWDELLQNTAYKPPRLNFPKNQGDEAVKEQLKAAKEAFKKEYDKRLAPFQDTSDQVLRDLAASSLAVKGLMDLVRDFDKAYSDAKRSRRILDFGDLEYNMVDLLLGKSRSGPTAAAREIGNRFREVMVDEYQDTNALQDAIYDALTCQRKNLFMVGDVKQSIYEFRLADPGIFLEKYHRFVPAETAAEGEDRKVLLSKNFRSSAGVLEGCNDVFRTCMCPSVGGLYYTKAEELNEGLAHIPLPTAETELCCIDVQQDTYVEEALFVANHIKDLLENGQVRQGDTLRPVKPEDVAILLRAPGSAGGYFRRALEQFGIRSATGDGQNLLNSEEISTFYAILQVIHNPRLDIPLVAAMSSPVFGFTADELAAIREKDKYACFYDTIRQSGDEKVGIFLEKLQKLRSAMGRYSLTRLLEQVMVETNFEEIYGAMEDGENRLSNIQTFFRLAVDYEALGNRDLGRFLEYIEAVGEKGLQAPGQQSAAGCVTIMSIHKSKGLEFPVVYLCNLGRQFNQESRRGNVLRHKTMGVGMSVADTENRVRYPTIAVQAISAQIGMDSVSEEMRILYVAMTRARDRLVMTYASNSLQRDLTAIVQRMNMGDIQSWIEDATCPGDWVLLTALQKTEAGALFALGGNPQLTNLSKIPWKITVNTAPQPLVDSPSEAVLEQTAPISLARLAQGLSFQYGHTAATAAPSKQTATGRKGREKDEEAAEHAGNKSHFRQWRKPSFLSGATQGKDYGNAVHRAMQYINYSACIGCQGVSDEIVRLVDGQFLTPEQGKLLDPKPIAAFFETDLGRKVMVGKVIREFKFSLLEDGAAFDSALSGEQVLMQGVVDCALLEEDGITVIDFKTDYVTEETLPSKLALYRPQVAAYADALGRIYQMPVKTRLLYFFHLGRFASV